MTPEQESGLFTSIGEIKADQRTIFHRLDSFDEKLEDSRRENQRTREAVESYAALTIPKLASAQASPQSRVPINGNVIAREEDKSALAIGRWFQSIPIIAGMFKKNITAIATVVAVVVVLLHEWKQMKREALHDMQASSPVSATDPSNAGKDVVSSGGKSTFPRRRNE